MGTRTVRLDEDVYERIRRLKDDDETFSEAIDRLTGTRSLAELGDVVDEERAAEMRAAVDAADEADAAEVDEVVDRFE